MREVSVISGPLLRFVNHSLSTDCQEKVSQSVRMKVNTNNRLIAGYLAGGMWVGFSYGCHLQPGGKQQGNSHQHAKDESLTEREMREKC